jgi:hypothetical protein
MVVASLRGLPGAIFDRSAGSWGTDAAPRMFEPQFTAALGLAIAIYPAAKIEIADAGVVLMPSKAPVSPKVVQTR